MVEERTVAVADQLDWQTRPTGSIIYRRRTSEAGTVKVLGHLLRIDPPWAHRLVRCEVDLDQQQIRRYRLRRRPFDQPASPLCPTLFHDVASIPARDINIL